MQHSVSRPEWGTVAKDKDAGTPDNSERGLEQILIDLDMIVNQTRIDGSELGIFPSMYRSVTFEIREAIHSGFFDDADAMEYLAVLFADRYLNAFRQWRNAQTIRDSWRVAFEAATDGRRRMIAQHLLAGMNAHINLDLGIVAAEVAGDQPEDLYVDFLRVNLILFRTLNGLQECLGSVSNRMAWVDKLGGTLDERMMRMAIRDARNGAWDLALGLIRNPFGSEEIIQQRDQQTADLGIAILGGALPIRMLSHFVARSEPADIRGVLDAFSDNTIDLDAVEAVVQLEAGARRRES